MNSKNSERLMYPQSAIKSEERAVVILSLSKHVHYLFMLCGTVLFNVSFAQTLSMQNVLDSVEHNNPMLASIHYKVTAANTLAGGAKAWMPPVVSAGFDQTPYAIQDGESFFNRTDGSAVIMIEQEIPNPSKLKAKYEYLSSLAAVDSASYGSLKNQMLTEAKTAYIERFISEKRLKIISEQIALLNLMIQTDTSTYAVNQSDLSSIYKTKARLHTMEAMQAHEKSAINEANSTLNYLMNRSSLTTFAIDSVIPFKNYTLSDFDTSSAYVSVHRSDILKIDKSINAMRLNSELVLSAAKPDFSIRFEHYDMFGMPNQFSLIGSVSIPIAPWSSRSYKTEALSMQQQINAMNLEKQNNLNEARSQMQQTLLHTIAEYEEVGHYENEVLPAYRKAVQSSLVAYRENTAQLFIPLMAWDDLNMAETEYLYHLEQAYKSEIAYENAIEKR